MNMHLHLHLLHSFQDFGPANAFWLYAFERYNGILGSFHTNNVRIECQIMQRFLESQSAGNEACGLMDEQFIEVLPKDWQLYDTAALNVNSQDVNVVKLLTAYSGPIANIDLVLHKAYILQYGDNHWSFKEYIITVQEIQSIEAVMREIFGAGVELKSKFGMKFGKLLIGDDLIG